MGKVKEYYIQLQELEEINKGLLEANECFAKTVQELRLEIKKLRQELDYFKFLAARLEDERTRNN